MNIFPFKDRHRESAEELYEQRCRLLRGDGGEVVALIALEQRLASHLHVLGLLGETAWDESGGDAARFVNYAIALQSRDRRRIEAACALAVEQLASGKGAAEPIWDAFTLYPPERALLIRIYREQPWVRPQLFSLWRRQMVELPLGLVKQAGLQRRNSELQYQALAYAADHPAFGLDLFRPRYVGLLGERSVRGVPHRMLVPCLWAGLVRGDRDALLALRRAVGQVEDENLKWHLLRLLALDGDRAHLPLLLEYHRAIPVSGVYLLALTGLAEAVPFIVEGLGDPAWAVESAKVWNWLTDLPLPTRPHLMLVGDEGRPRYVPANRKRPLKLVPDQHAARIWWRNHERSWQGRRRIMGKVLDLERLLLLAPTRVGDVAEDILALLALELQRPIGIGRWGWTALRCLKLASLGRPRILPTSSRCGP